MSAFSRLGLAFLIVFGLHVELASAQDKGKKVTITTIDGVNLAGTYYQGEPKEPPVVIMLHALGEHSQQKAYTELAESLMKYFSVLTFDFRGHGQSTGVDTNEFYKYPRNKQTGSTGATIEYKKFNKGYYPVLVNDIAAARAFLERTKNDTSKEANISNVVLIGAETGATLGALWLNSEWYRYRFGLNMFGQMQYYKKPEGADVSTAIWLSITPILGTTNAKLAPLLDPALRLGPTQMAFLVADGDAKSKKIAADIVAPFKKSKEFKDKLKFTDVVEIKGSNKLAGSGLLQKSLNTEGAIIDYLKETTSQGSRELFDRKFRDSQYVWVMNNQPYAAKVSTTNNLPLPFVVNQRPIDTHLFYDTYEKFLPK